MELPVAIILSPTLPTVERKPSIKNLYGPQETPFKLFTHHPIGLKLSPLLNEFLKEDRKVWELQTNAIPQQKQIAALTAGLEKVNTKLKVAPKGPIV